MIKYISFVLLLCFIIGCGSGHVALKGNVVFSDNGEPLTAGSVLLVKENFQSQGTIDGKGAFSMESLRLGDGLPPGTYRVSIRGASVYDDSGAYSLIDPKWTSPDTSGLTVEVDKKTRFLEIKVDRNPVPRRR